MFGEDVTLKLSTLTIPTPLCDSLIVTLVYVPEKVTSIVEDVSDIADADVIAVAGVIVNVSGIVS